MNDLEKAEKEVERRVAIGLKEEEALIEKVKKAVISDKLVPPTREAMEFGRDPIFQNGELILHYKNADGSFNFVKIHPHAFGQLCEKVKLPMTYANMLNGPEDWRLGLLSRNLNLLFYNTPFKSTGGEAPRFLHRIVDNELRGFLSRRFNRFLASAPLLNAFVDACRANGAKPVGATTTAVRSALKCILPKVYEPFPGEYICIGVEWSNSDFGAGKLAVCQTVWRVATGTSAVLDESISRVHLGSIIEDSDLEMSDDTARKEVTAQQSAIADIIAQDLSDKTVDRLLLAMQKAAEEQIPWSSLKARLKGILLKNELEWMESTLQSTSMGIIDLPPISFDAEKKPQANAYWASSVMALLAGEAGDDDRRLELEKEAGKFLATSLKT